MKEERIMNLTPHPVVLLEVEENKIEQDRNGIFYADPADVIPRHTILSSGIARVKMNNIPGGAISGINVVDVEYDLVNLPDPVAGTYLIVSQVVAQVVAIAGRDTSDLLIPDGIIKSKTTPGHVLGCRRLKRMGRIAADIRRVA